MVCELYFKQNKMLNKISELYQPTIWVNVIKNNVELNKKLQKTTYTNFPFF